MNEKLRILENILTFSHQVSEEYLFWCKFCPKMHHKPKLSVNFNKNTFKCWICESSGKNLYYLVKKFGDFEDCQKWLEFTDETDLSEFDVVFGNLGKVEKVKTKIKLPKDFKSLSVCEKEHDAFQYMTSRNFTYYDMVRWRVGYCEDGMYSNRIVFPSFDFDGNLNFFTTRSYVNHFQSYKNPKIEKKPIFNEFEVDWRKEVVLVEGPFDMVKVENSCPLLGTYLSEDCEIFKKIKMFKTPTYLALDKDAISKSIKIIKMLVNFGIKTRLIDLRPFKDPGEMSNLEFLKRKLNSEIITSDNILILEINNAF